MADNIQVTPGAGATVATDDVAGVEYQRVKVDWGPDGSAVDTDDTDAARLPVGGSAIGKPGDGAWSGTGNGGLIAILKNIAAKLVSGIPIIGSVALGNAEGVKGQVGGIVANPNQSISRLANTTPYLANQIVANTTTAASVAYPPLTVPRVAAGSFQSDRGRLYTNTTSGLAGASVRVHLWSAAPTYSAGDGGTYGVAAGAAGYLGSFTGVFEQFGDGALAILQPDYGSPCIKLASGQSVWWDVQTLSGFTPQASTTYALTLEAKQD